MKERLLPLGIKDPVKTELPALVALEAIGQSWFGDAHLAELRAIGLIAELTGGEAGGVRAMAGELLALLDRGALDVATIRPLVMELTGWLQRQPNGRVQAAIEKLLRQECGIEA